MELSPKEKARELVEKFLEFTTGEEDNGFTTIYSIEKHKKNATQCAIIAADEIINQWEYIDTYISDGMGKLNLNLKYWNEVKSELEKI